MNKKNRYSKYYIWSFLITFLLLFNSCKKFLEQKPNKRLAEISNLTDARALMENYTLINYKGVTASEISAGDCYLTDSDLKAREQYNRNLYLWSNNNVFNLSGGNDWSSVYYVIYVSNTILKSLQNIDRNQDSVTWDNIKGEALYYQGIFYQQAAYCWSKTYNESQASNTLGIPLRESDDFTDISVRASLLDTYNQIINDLKQAITLLPINSNHPLRPTKAAAYGMLSRLYLSMNNFELANLFADSALSLRNQLMDYNDKTLIPSTTTTFAFPQSLNNPELIQEIRISSPMLSYAYAKIDSTLYNSYDINDLRKVLFFRTNSDGSHSFRGSYVRSVNLSYAICVDELYLIKAESEIRSGNKEEALLYLNSLLEKRYKTGTFEAIESENSQEILQIILLERRKELLMRGLRWADIKRLNDLGEKISLYRNYDGSNYSLSANSERFAIPLPEDIISLSGMEQNDYN